jgi:hypothetical protein
LTYLLGNHEKLEQLKHELEVEAHGLDMEWSRKRIKVTRREREHLKKLGKSKSFQA